MARTASESGGKGGSRVWLFLGDPAKHRSLQRSVVARELRSGMHLHYKATVCRQSNVKMVVILKLSRNITLVFSLPFLPSMLQQDNTKPF